MMMRRRVCKVPIERQTLSLAIYRQRAKVRQKKLDLEHLSAVKTGRAPFKPKKNNNVFALKDFEDDKILLDDPDDIIENLEKLYEKIYTDWDPLPMWIREPFDTDIMDKLPKLTRNTLRLLIDELPRGKTSAADLVVIEMLKDLPDDLCDILIDLYTRRLLNHEVPDLENFEDPWGEIVANLIAKILRPETVRQFRPIAIIPVLAKLYSKVLLFWAKPSLMPLRGPQFAFRKTYQPHEVVYILRSITDKCIEWAIPIWLCDGDIHKAFDFTKHSNVLKALVKKGCPKPVAAAWTRENRDTKVRLRLGDLETRAICRTRALLQGDPAAPNLFNYTLDDPLYKFSHVAKTENGAYQSIIQDSRFTILEYFVLQTIIGFYQLHPPS